jgi:hypothetical protein
MRRPPNLRGSHITRTVSLMEVLLLSPRTVPSHPFPLVICGVKSPTLDIIRDWSRSDSARLTNFNVSNCLWSRCNKEVRCTANGSLVSTRLSTRPLHRRPMVQYFPSAPAVSGRTASLQLNYGPYGRQLELTDENYPRRRCQRRFNGVPCEVRGTSFF